MANVEAAAGLHILGGQPDCARVVLPELVAQAVEAAPVLRLAVALEVRLLAGAARLLRVAVVSPVKAKDRCEATAVVTTRPTPTLLSRRNCRSFSLQFHMSYEPCMNPRLQ